MLSVLFWIDVFTFNFSILHNYMVVFDSWEEEKYHFRIFLMVIVELDLRGLTLHLEIKKLKIFFREIEKGNCQEGLWHQR